MTAPTARTARTVAQAKVNLFLRVLAREDNGYHQLETLFCRLELGDQVVVRTETPGRSLDVTGPALPVAGLGPVHRNLAWRAAEAFSARAGWPNGWAIEIDKRIPVGGGLGGGSADAGAVLRCLNALAPTPLDPPTLLEIAGTLGADVPFVSVGAPLALAWGRGDHLLHLDALPPRDIALACFAFGVPTPEAYQWLDEARAGAPSASSVDLSALRSWRRLATLAHNDFEAVVAARFPQIAHVLSAWRTLASSADASVTMLSGSGSTVFQAADHLPPGVDEAVGTGVTVLRSRTANRVVDVEVAD